MIKEGRNSLKQIKSQIDILSRHWFMIVCLFIFISIAVLFILSFVYSKDKEITLDTINSWVSLILGIVATLLSIISMMVSFYNLERTNEINDENLESMKELQKKVEQTVEGMEKTLMKITQLENVVSKKLNTSTQVTDSSVQNDTSEWETISSEKE